MSSLEEPSRALARFSGTVRLFPLPNLVLFPHVMQPLHIFEPRYRDMLEDALAGDRLITMALLAPGWERNYEGRPPLHPMACLAQITTHFRLPDGTYNVLLLGLQRVKLGQELAPPRSFRQARAVLCPEQYQARPLAEQDALHKKLRESFLTMLPTLPEAEEQLDHLLADDVPLGIVTDIVSYMLNLDLLRKQSLLSETDVFRRAELLLTNLHDIVTGVNVATSAIDYPPVFSMN